jgi:hypothetical protein
MATRWSNTRSMYILIDLFIQTFLQFWTVFVSHSFFVIGLQTCRSTGEQTVLGTNFSTLEQILSELGLHFRSVTSLGTNWHSSTWVGSQDFLVTGLHVSLKKRINNFKSLRSNRGKTCQIFPVPKHESYVLCVMGTIAHHRKLEEIYNLGTISTQEE